MSGRYLIIILLFFGCILPIFFVILRGNFIGMTITELQQQYSAHPNMAVMKRLLKDTSVQTVFCGGLCASAASLFSSVLVQEGGCPFVFILGDLEAAIRWDACLIWKKPDISITT